MCADVAYLRKSDKPEPELVQRVSKDQGADPGEIAAALLIIVYRFSEQSLLQ